MDQKAEDKVHMGRLVQQKVKEQQLSPGKFGELINTSRTNVYSIFSRKEIKLDLLKLISKKLNYDFLQHISFQNDEVTNPANINIIINIDLKNEELDEFAQKTLDYFQILRKLIKQ